MKKILHKALYLTGFIRHKVGKPNMQGGLSEMKCRHVWKTNGGATAKTLHKMILSVCRIMREASNGAPGPGCSLAKTACIIQSV